MPFAKAMPGIAAAAARGISGLASGYRAGASVLGRSAGSMYARQGAGLGAKNIGLGIGAASMRYIGQGMRGISRMGATGIMGTTGAIAGGMYGAMSSDTSVVGGALMGAGLGVGAVGAARLGRRGLGMYNYTRTAGMGRGAAAAQGGLAMGDMAKSFIGNSYTKAINQFSSGMKAGIR